MSLSIILYSYGAHFLLPSVENSMAEKERFGTALALAYLVSLLLKSSFLCARFFPLVSTLKMLY